MSNKKTVDLSDKAAQYFADVQYGLPGKNGSAIATNSDVINESLETLGMFEKATDNQLRNWLNDFEKLPNKTKEFVSNPINVSSASDGYHTFTELYEHRVTLFICLCRLLKREIVWRSKLHHDGSSFDGWFIMGIQIRPGEQISYHLPMSEWSETDFAFTLEKAPEWDGHTSNDVLNRIKALVIN